MSTISELLTSIAEHIASCFTAVATKSGTVPTIKNASTLVTAIYSINDTGESTPPSAAPVAPDIEATMDSMEAHLGECYAAVQAKRGTLPAQKTWANLPAAIRSIPSAYGYLGYTDEGGDERTYIITSASEMQQLSSANQVNGNFVLTQLTVAPNQIRTFEFTSLGAGVMVRSFLWGCENLTTVTGTELMTQVGANFCYGCTKLNCPLYYPGAKILSTTSELAGEAFLQGCTSFNSPVTISPTATIVGRAFLYGCTAFNQPVSLPSTITRIDYGFLDNCRSFNQPLVVPSKITLLNSSFMEFCTSFNSSLTLPSGLTEIGNHFMRGCYNFNQPITIPNSVTKISYGFMMSTTNFAQPLNLPSNLTSLGEDFMAQPTNFTGPLWVPAGITYPTDDTHTLSNYSSNINVPAYQTGVTITGPGAAEFRAAFPNGNTNATNYRKLL